MNLESIDGLKSETKDNKIKTFFALFFMQTIQIITIFLPGEPVEILAGLLLGSWIGLICCILGSVLGTVIIYLISILLGKKIINKIFKKEKRDKIKYLNDPKKISRLIFILFLIPGTPKDLITYFAFILPIGFYKFLFLSTIARIPSIITSTFLGEQILKKEYKLVIIFSIVMILIAAIGLIINKLIEKKYKKDKIKNDL